MSFDVDIKPLIIKNKIYYSLFIIREMREAGYTLKKIGNLHGVSHVAIHIWLKRNDVETDVDIIHEAGKTGNNTNKLRLNLPRWDNVNKALWDLQDNPSPRNIKRVKNYLLSIYGKCVNE